MVHILYFDLIHTRDGKPLLNEDFQITILGVEGASFGLN